MASQQGNKHKFLGVDIDTEVARRYNDLVNLMKNETCENIINIVKSKKRINVGEIVKQTGISQPYASSTLKKLASLGVLIKDGKENKKVFYKFDPEKSNRYVSIIKQFNAI